MITGTAIVAEIDSSITSRYTEFEKNYPTMAKYGLHGKSNDQYKLLQELLLHWWNEGGKNKLKHRRRERKEGNGKRGELSMHSRKTHTTLLTMPRNPAH